MDKLKKFKLHYDNKEIGTILAHNRNEANNKALIIVNHLGKEKPYSLKVVKNIL